MDFKLNNQLISLLCWSLNARESQETFLAKVDIGFTVIRSHINITVADNAVPTQQNAYSISPLLGTVTTQ